MTEESMHAREVPNWMLYDLIMEFKKDVDRRFENMERKFESLEAKVDRNYEVLDAKIDASNARMEAKIDRTVELVTELYKRGDKVKIGFSRQVLLGNGAFAAVIAFFTSLFTGYLVVDT